MRSRMRRADRLSARQAGERSIAIVCGTGLRLGIGDGAAADPGQHFSGRSNRRGFGTVRWPDAKLLAVLRKRPLWAVAALGRNVDEHRVPAHALVRIVL